MDLSLVFIVQLFILSVERLQISVDDSFIVKLLSHQVSHLRKLVHPLHHEELQAQIVLVLLVQLPFPLAVLPFPAVISGGYLPFQQEQADRKDDDLADVPGRR